MAYFLNSFTCTVISVVHFFFPVNVIPSSMCYSQSPVEVNLQNICSKTYNSVECLNQFKSDPRSLNADMKGLAEISVDLALNKANTVHDQYNQLDRDTKDSELQEKYVTCSKNYNDAIRDLQTVKKYLDDNRYRFISVEINDALQEVMRCRNAFKKDPVDPDHMDYQNDEFKLLCYMVKVTSDSLIHK